MSWAVCPALPQGKSFALLDKQTSYCTRPSSGRLFGIPALVVSTFFFFFLNNTLVFKVFCYLVLVSDCFSFLKITIPKFLSVGNS